MTVLRFRPKGAKAVLFGLAAPVFCILPNSIGYQDLASLIAQQPAVSQRWRAHMIASPFGTIHAATFSFPRPIGTAVPEPESYRLASFDPHDPTIAGPLARPDAPLSFPTVDRTRKGDFLKGPPAPSPAASEAPAATPASAAETLSEEPPLPDIATQVLAPDPPRPDPLDEIEAAVRFAPFPEYDISMSLELHPQVPVEPVDPSHPDADPPDLSLIAMANDPDPTERMSRLFFGGSPMSTFAAAIEPWLAGEEPILMMPRAPAPPAVAALPAAPDAKPAPDPNNSGPGGVTLAEKGGAAKEEKRLPSPAERLKLSAKGREKAEKCLANAVYFESRNEPVRGQIGVAQVVMNRVFSGFYPGDVCSVVYQNAHRHLACQFTFACDGIPDIVTDHESWARAKRIAAATLDGKVWLADIGKATHYHANYVHPYWVRSMRKLRRIGAHIFYRPRGWGDGSDAPSWGGATAAADAAAKL
jgi:spore germination cell wall hydrolase CwlJ-like protein